MDLPSQHQLTTMSSTIQTVNLDTEYNPSQSVNHEVTYVSPGTETYYHPQQSNLQLVDELHLSQSPSHRKWYIYLKTPIARTGSGVRSSNPTKWGTLYTREGCLCYTFSGTTQTHVDLRVLTKICVPFLTMIDGNFPDEMTCDEFLRSSRIRSILKWFSILSHNMTVPDSDKGAFYNNLLFTVDLLQNYYTLMDEYQGTLHKESNIHDFFKERRFQLTFGLDP